MVRLGHKLAYNTTMTAHSIGQIGAQIEGKQWLLF
jgi:hypothetical protein